MTAQPARADRPAPAPEWEQAWTLADQLDALAAGLSPDVFDDAGWELRGRIAEHAAAAKALGHRLAGQAVDRFTVYVSDADRPAEWYQRLSDQADAATAAIRARATRSADRDCVRDAGWER